MFYLSCINDAQTTNYDASNGFSTRFVGLQVIAAPSTRLSSIRRSRVGTLRLTFRTNENQVIQWSGYILDAMLTTDWRLIFRPQKDTLITYKYFHFILFKISYIFQKNNICFFCAKIMNEQQKCVLVFNYFHNYKSRLYVPS